jgi:hypothetical protein
MNEPVRPIVHVPLKREEYGLLAGMAQVRGISLSELVRELIGLDAPCHAPVRRHLRLIAGSRAPHRTEAGS